MINIDRKVALFFVGIFVLVVGVGLVVGGSYASSRTGMGHDLDELSGVDCSDGDVLTRVSGAWSCSPSSSPSPGGDQIVILSSIIPLHASSSGDKFTWANRNHDYAIPATIPAAAKYVIVNLEARVETNSNGPQSRSFQLLRHVPGGTFGDYVYSFKNEGNYRYAYAESIFYPREGVVGIRAVDSPTKTDPSNIRYKAYITGYVI